MVNPYRIEKEMDFWTIFVLLDEKEDDPKVVKLVEDLARVTTIKRYFPVDDGSAVGVDTAVGAGVGIVGGGIDVVGEAADETVVGETTITAERGIFSPIGGGDFGTPFAIGRFGDLGAGPSKVPGGVYSCEKCNDRINWMMAKM